MSTNVRVQVLIRKRRHEVAATMFDPERDAIWSRSVVETRPLTPSSPIALLASRRLRVGSRFQRTSVFFGRTLSYECECVAAEEDRFVELRVGRRHDDGRELPFRVRYELQDAPEGTYATIHARSDAPGLPGFLRLASPFLAPVLRRSMRRDLESLKRHLEQPAA